MKKKKIIKIFTILLAILSVIFIAINFYSLHRIGNQKIKINSLGKVYANNKNVFLINCKSGESDNIDFKGKFKLFDSDNKEVKDAKFNLNKDELVLDLPDVEGGEYLLKGKISSKSGTDKVKVKVNVNDKINSNVTITFDKGIYKPNDVVKYRILLTDKLNDFAVKDSINVSIYDGNNNRIISRDCETSDYGIVSGEFQLADEVNSGVYRLSVSVNNSIISKEFKVNPYVTPKFKVDFKANKENFYINDKGTFDISSEYFFNQDANIKECKLYVKSPNDSDFIVASNVKKLEGNKFTFDYDFKNVGDYSFKVELVDNSNYYAEAIKNYKVGYSKYNIKCIPEFGKLIPGEQNRVFVYVTDSNGNPSKVKLEISSKKEKKTFLTGENGVAVFNTYVNNINTYNTTSEKLPYIHYMTNDESTESKKNEKSSENTNKDIGANYYKEFYVKVDDLKGFAVNVQNRLEVSNKEVFLKTDKVKYNVNEKVKVSVSKTDKYDESFTENTEYEIVAYKGDRIINSVSTSSNEVEMDLEGNYGFVDILVYRKDILKTRYASEDLSISKRTIFVKPDKKLNIGISTNKDQFKPGDNINITFDVSDENKSGIDAALLVSMIDNANLNIMDNDISVDNLKLALSDIELTDEIDAATAYACLLDDKNEVLLESLLLQQSNQKLINKIQAESDNNINVINLCIFGFIVVLIISIIVFCKAQFNIKISKSVKKLVNFVSIGLLVFLLTGFMFSNMDFYEMDSYVLNLFRFVIFPIMLTILLFMKVLNKYEDILYRINISGISIFIFSLFVKYMMEEHSVALFVIALVLLVFMLINTIIEKIAKNRKNKNIQTNINVNNNKSNRFIDFIIKVNTKINNGLNKGLEYFIIYVISLSFAVIIGLFVGDIFELNGEYEILVLSLIFIGNYFIYPLVKKLFKKKVFKILGIIWTIFVVLSFFSNFSFIDMELYTMYNTEKNDMDLGYDDDYYGHNLLDPQQVQINSTSIDGKNSSSSIIHNPFNVLDMFNKDTDKNSMEMSENKNDNVDNVIVKEDKLVNDGKEDKIRNNFLETICFVPELVTRDGKGELDLKLADNITTWTIQTVGNTKDGRVGYSSNNNVKVFKDFFIDFDIPNNIKYGDKMWIPVTAYNYSGTAVNVNLKVDLNDSIKLIDKDTYDFAVESKQSKMVYVPVEFIKYGDSKLKISAKGNEFTDVVEKRFNVKPNGYKTEQTVSSGYVKGSIKEDGIALPKNYVKGTTKLKIKLYASSVNNYIENMDSILKMPNGCFEQISSSLYPDILVLKYIEKNQVNDVELKNKALRYIEKGYQKMLTYEVPEQKGGYSLYGDNPASVHLTAYGLLQLNELKDVYPVEDVVLFDMENYIYSEMGNDGEFINRDYIYKSNRDITETAYIAMALSEYNPNNNKLQKVLGYLKEKLDTVDDNYTLALIANTLANVGDKDAKKVVNKIFENITNENDVSYASSDNIDFCGTRGRYMDVSTTALTSSALSKLNYKYDLNQKMIDYILKSRDSKGCWYNTQSTALSLRALDEFNSQVELKDKKVTIKLNDSEVKTDFNKKNLNKFIYEFDLFDIEESNSIEIICDDNKDKIYYEVVEEYYIPYANIENNNSFDIKVDYNKESKVTDLLNTKVSVTNNSSDTVINAMIKINIPLGFVVDESSLDKLVYSNVIEKYDMNYNTLNIYVKNLEKSELLNLDIKFRSLYPVDTKGLSMEVYDYYNTDVKTVFAPVPIIVNQ